MLKYPARIKYSKEEDVYEVSFPDVRGCATFGETLEEALKYAKEALSGCLESILENNLKLREPSKISGKDIYYISPELNVSFAILLRREREARKLTQKQVADRLAISYQAYQKYENPRRANPTLKTIAKIEKIFGKSFVQI
jgi:antitoxin HicB